jgi:pimeloyl-ACP methyl ester carboxylesterase
VSRERATLVFVPGLLAGSWIWDDAAAQLTDHHTVTLELPAHGDCPSAPAAVPLAQLVDEVVRVAGEVAGPVALVGQSLGAVMCLHAAPRVANLTGLVLVGMPLAPETAASRARRLGTLAAMARLGVRPVLRAMAAWLFGRSTRRDAPERVARWLDAAAHLDPAGVVRTAHAALARPDGEPALARVAVPALVVSGSEDLVLGRDEAARTARGLARATAHELAGCGHQVPIERGTALGQLIHDWIDQGEFT